MKAKRMMFSAEMAQAIQERRKGVTRRVVQSKFADIGDTIWQCEGINGHDDYPNHAEFKRMAKPGETFISQSIYIDCPYQVGELIAVCEPWQVIESYDTPSGSAHIPDDASIFYGQGDGLVVGVGRQRLARFMPIRFVRNFLRVTAVRVERMQEITEEQAVLEGVETLPENRDLKGIFYKNYYNHPCEGFWQARDSFASLIDYLHGEGTWASNPWVWVIEFEILDVGDVRHPRFVLRCPSCNGTDGLKNVGVGVNAGTVYKCLECRHEWEHGGAEQ